MTGFGGSDGGKWRKLYLNYNKRERERQLTVMTMDIRQKTTVDSITSTIIFWYYVFYYILIQ